MTAVRIHPETAESIKSAVRLGLESLRAEPPQRLGDWAQEHDEPLLFVPHHMHAADASLVRWSADALQISDIHAYQPDNEAWRLMSGALDLEPVFA